MQRAYLILLMLAGCCGCASKSLPAANPTQPPSLAQRIFGGLPHPGERVAARHAIDDYDDDKRDKDTDF